MTKKRTLTVVICLAVFALLLTLYLAVIKPLTADDEETPALPLVLVDDIEQEGPNSRYLMFPYIEKSNVSSIKVTNVYGTYEVYYDGEDFLFRDHETAPYNEQLMAYLINSTGYTLAMKKMCDGASAETMAQYGLSEPQASWTITSRDGQEYSVDVGSKLVTGAGYYCRFVGRDSVYILAQSLEYTVLQPVEVLVSPLLISGIDSTTYYMMDNFTVLHGEELFFASKIKAKSEQTDPDATLEIGVIYPGSYEPSDDFYYEALYTLSSLSGTSVVKLGYTDDDLMKYGLTSPAYTVGFTYSETDIMLLFSEKQEDGTYYAVSSLNPDAIVVIDSSSVSFLEADILEWVSPYLFRYAIATIKAFSVTDKDGNATAFALYHSTDESGNALLDVQSSTGKTIPNAEVYNFRLYYKVLIMLAIKGDAPFTEDEVADIVANETPYFSFAYLTTAGKTAKLDFYRYSTRRSLVTVNGKGQFYVITDTLDKIINDTYRVLNDIEVDSYGKN